MQNSIVREYSLSFDSQALTTHNFTINAPAELPVRDINLVEVYLVSGTWDDCGTIGSFVCPCQLGVVCTTAKVVKIAEKTTKVLGTVQNLIAGGCTVKLKLEWTYGGTDCPIGYCKCKINRYPGYCCLPCKDVAEKINRLAQRCNCG